MASLKNRKQLAKTISKADKRKKFRRREVVSAVLNAIISNTRMVQNASLYRAEMIRAMLEHQERDIDLECGYPEDITATDYDEMYQRNGVGTRVNDIYTEECWAMSPSIFETEEQNTTSFEEALAELTDVTRGNLFHYLERADRLSGIGEFGIIFLGIADKKDLDQPVTGIDEDGNSILTEIQEKARSRGKTPGKTGATTGQTGVQAGSEPPDDEEDEDEDIDTEDVSELEEVDESAGTTPFEGLKKLMYMRVFSQKDVEIKTYNADPKSKRFGLPVEYEINFADVKPDEGETGQSLSTKGTTVHWTRVIHLADNRESSETFGVPRQKNVFNNLLNIKKVLGAGAEGYWQGGFPGLSIESQPGQEEIEMDEELTKEQINRYINKLQRYLALVGFSAKTLSPNVADPTPHFDVQCKAIALTKGIPYRIFMGSEEAKLASSQDTTAWNKRLGRRQETYLTPMVIRPVIDRLLGMEILPMPAEGKYEVSWPDLHAPSEDQKATTAAKQTEALKNYVAGDVEQIIPPLEFLTHIMGFDLDEAEKIIKAMEEHVEELEVEEQEMRDEGINPKTGLPIPDPAEMARGGFPPNNRNRAPGVPSNGAPVGNKKGKKVKVKK